ncbi:MAG: hypothetical protein ACLU62_01675 [Hydrogeniiclostridium sp.]
MITDEREIDVCGNKANRIVYASQENRRIHIDRTKYGANIWGKKYVSHNWLR